MPALLELHSAFPLPCARPSGCRFFLSWKIATAAHGLSITEEFFYRSAGRTLPDMVSALHQSTHGTPATAGFVAAFLDTKIAANKQYELKHGHPDEITTVVSIALAAQAKGIPIACATSGLREVRVDSARVCGPARPARCRCDCAAVPLCRCAAVAPAARVSRAFRLTATLPWSSPENRRLCSSISGRLGLKRSSRR